MTCGRWWSVEIVWSWIWSDQSQIHPEQWTLVVVRASVQLWWKTGSLWNAVFTGSLTLGQWQRGVRQHTNKPDTIAPSTPDNGIKTHSTGAKIETNIQEFLKMNQGWGRLHNIMRAVMDGQRLLQFICPRQTSFIIAARVNLINSPMCESFKTILPSYINFDQVWEFDEGDFQYIFGSGTHFRLLRSRKLKLNILWHTSPMFFTGTESDV